MDYISRGLGVVLNFFYSLVNNYGVAIILFTVFIKLILLPLTLKQQKSMAKTQKIQPLLMEVQKKYANDKEKLNQETMKLYQKYNINPMGGCLPMLIQLPIIFALYWVVKKPITYMLGVNASEIWRVYDAFNAWVQVNGGLVADTLKNIQLKDFGNYEIQVAQQMFIHPDILNYPALSEWGVKLQIIDFNFLGLNLAETPNLGALLGVFVGNVSGMNLDTILLWIIPILSGLSAWWSSKVSMAKTNNAPKQEDQPNVANSMKTMMVFMPIFSAWITFSLPAAVGLYWIVSNLIQVLQQIWVNSHLAADLDIEGEIVNAKKSRKKRQKS